MKNEQPFEVRPADLLDQPQCSTNLSIEQTSTTEIFKLNRDFLLHMFKFLDVDSCVNMADVCKMFRQLLVMYHFPLIALTLSILIANIGTNLRRLKIDTEFGEEYKKDNDGISVLAFIISGGTASVSHPYKLSSKSNAFAIISQILSSTQVLRICAI